jgi:hypothetical protein
MIVDEIVEIKIAPSNFKYYKDRAYIFNKCGDIINVSIADLSSGSKVRIRCKCYYCYSITTPIYVNYIQQTKNIDKYACSKCSHIKRVETVRQTYGVDYTLQVATYKKDREITNMQKYGSISPFGSYEIRNKIKKTNLEKWGVENIFQSEDIKDLIKQKNIENGNWIDDLSGLNSYRRRIKTLTNKVKLEFINNWDGYDYYDNEYIKENLKLYRNNRLYPTIDHKISIFSGFLKKIDPVKISSIDNLCMTKRYINSSKNKKTESEFKTS